MLQLTPHYRRLRDSILRPHLRLTESRYFWEKWKPRLGADAAVLIMEVRDRCNKALGMLGQAFKGEDGLAGATRASGANGVNEDATRHALDGVDGATEGTTVSAAELAAACGFSRVTLWRLLQREEVRQFVRVEHNYVYDRRIGKKRRTLSTYHVLMEDPLVPEDEPRLQQLLSAQNPDHAATRGSRFHIETEVVDNAASTFQFETTEGGFKQKPQNVQRTLVNKRLAGTTPSQPRGGQPAKLGSLLAGSGLPLIAGQARPGDNGIRSGTEVGAAVRAGGGVGAVDIWRSFPGFAHYVEEAETLLQDRHSRGFYVNALKKLFPDHMAVWQRALTVAREQTNIRRSRGALFSRLLRTFAAEAGVGL